VLYWCVIGLYDMIGNVWEWTHSRYFERLIARDLQSQMHVLKGGSFVDTVDGEINLAVRNGQRSVVSSTQGCVPFI
jgi:formylglycine-generating enzyme required for sulfatase activity